MELFKISNLFNFFIASNIKLKNHPIINCEEHVRCISFRYMKIRSNDVVKSGVLLKWLFHWFNNFIYFIAIIAFPISFFKNNQESLYYGNFNGYFMFENRIILDLIFGYLLYLTFILKLFYSQFTLEDSEFKWIFILHLFSNDIEPKKLELNRQLVNKLWQSTMISKRTIKFFINLEIILIFSFYVWAYTNLPDYFKYSLAGFIILFIEFILIINIFKTFESFYFLFGIVCKYLNFRASYVFAKFDSFINTFERKINNQSIDNIKNKYSRIFVKTVPQDFEHYSISKLLQEHNSICVLVKKYNSFWQFYLLAIFSTTPVIIGYFISLLIFDQMYYIHRISLAIINIFLISYFYLLTVPAVHLSNTIRRFMHPLKFINKYHLPDEIRYKIQTYLLKFESKVSFNCYGIFNVTNEAYLDIFFSSETLIFLTLQLINTNFQYKLKLTKN